VTYFLLWKKKKVAKKKSILSVREGVAEKKLILDEKKK
jgi:hypothetical protein